MKEKNKYLVLAYTALFLLFNVIAFVAFEQRDLKFWTSYAFGVLAFLLQLAHIGILSFENSHHGRRVYGLPVWVISFIYCLIQMAVAFVFMSIDCKYRTSLLVQAIVLLSYLVILFVLVGGLTHAAETEADTKYASDTIHRLSFEAETLYNGTEDPARKAEIKKLAEALRYADPMSRTHKAMEMDHQISNAFEALKNSLDRQSTDNTASDVKKLIAMIDQRSMIIKTEK
ncbi:MAG: hypothetical protein IKG34_13430 [Solobacterium sp.]|nr:hypothetical protein [Solobacterium sp.]